MESIKKKKKFREAIFTIFKKDTQGNDTNEVLIYLHPTKGYKGNKKYIKQNKLHKRKRKITGGGK